MKDITKDKDILKERMFQSELEVLAQAEEILSSLDIARQELQEEYRHLSEKYEKLLKDTMKITRVGDVNYKKLMSANDQIQRQKSELEVLNRELRQTNAAKDKFYSIIAHDLRNPLEFLLFASDMVENEHGQLREESLQKYAARVFATAKNMSELLENLLQWSRSQYGEIECQPQQLDLSRLVGDNIEFLMETARRKNIELLLDIPANTWIYADENMTRCVFRNLIGNALKFTNPGGQVRLSARQEGDLIVTSIQDTGVGIAKEKLDSLFKMGQNHISNGTAKEKGSSLGLILCREFVEKNGGKIWVKSGEGEGSLFEFSLPRWT